jgi:hypothetical protein
MVMLPTNSGKKPFGIISPDGADPWDDVRRVEQVLKQYGEDSVQYERGIEELGQKYGDAEQLAGRLGLGQVTGDAYSPSLQPGERAPIIEERSGSLPPMSPPQNVSPQPSKLPPTPGQKPTAGVNDPVGRLGTRPTTSPDPMGRLGTPSQANTGGTPPTPGTKPQAPGSGSGQDSGRGFFETVSSPGFQTMLGGLAAGAAQAGNLPHFGYVLSSAAAGGRQATRKAQQQRMDTALTQAQIRAELMKAAQDGDRTQFERLLAQSGLSKEEQQRLIRQYIANEASDSARGVVVEQNEDGFTIRTNAPQGGSSGSGNQTATKNQLEEELVKIEDRIGRIEDIEETYNSEFLETFERLKMKGAAFWEKLAGRGSLGPETERKLRNYTVFQANALDNLNRYIHEMTGAQLSQFEAERLRAPLPDPGEGAIARMSPTQFEAALQRIKETAKNSKKRKEYLMRNGVLQPGQEVTEDLAKQYPLSMFDEDGAQSLSQIQDMSTEKLQDEYQRLREKANEQDLGKQRRRELARRAQVVVDELNSRGGQ